MSTPTVAISHFAKLAQLTLSPAQEELLSSQFSSTLSLVNLISRLDTQKIPATSQVTGLKNVFRRDKIDLTRLLPPPPKKYYIVKAIFKD